MMKILILLLLVLCSCSDKSNDKYKLVFDTDSIVNCILFIYEFDDGTRIYTDYTNIKYISGDNELTIKEALEKGLLNLEDIKNYEEFRIVESNDKKPTTCLD